MEIQMNELIKIEKSNVGGDLIETVNARELYQFLKVGRDFSTWIKRRIEQYGFEEGVDFCSFLSESTGNRSSKGCAFDSPEMGNQTSGRGGDRRSIEYHISLDMAKELAMGEISLKTRKSSVVVTNPTHLAVALFYQQDVTPLPVVMAKGKDLAAYQMVNVARQFGIPVMQNVWLARALTESAQVDQYIPSDLIEPIAELLIALRRIAGDSAEGAS